ncbi:DEAD/DEAH box RNA helicase, putative [Cordyceps militaris CM01]|uniref:RNA helicase n=1 Tax=Cordyceps militaris (strain CM01) TaxID=983644 RepID=G3JA09_CORMM|nr:DEAD/DEAH box RNA helicase, putative [Cordyceps militaris CM01]EGX95029.1 DEAD/DEAH box RNA helicase, putative [Cordyceps militaris CM01]
MDSAYPQAVPYQAAAGHEVPQDDASFMQSRDTFDGSAPIYQWNDEYGDVGPKIDSLELELFGDPKTRHERTGLDFRRIEVKQEGPVQIVPIRSFDDAGLHPVMLDNVKLAGYDHPTPIQKYTIPAIVQGRDVIGIAQTGSGKTAAYLIPILSRLMGKVKKLAAPRPNPATFCEGRDEVTAEPLVLVISPTRELAVQIFNEARKFCYRTMLRPGVVYGGTPVADQIHLLNRGCDVLIGTPGRLVSFINKPRVLTLRRLKYLIIDEADEMLDIGWQEDIQRIMLGGDQDEGNVKYGLFSATFPKQARDLAKEHLAAAHVRFRVGRAGSTTENIKQIIVKAEPHEKRNILLQLLNEIHGVRTIIFANSRQEVDCLDDFLFNMKLPVTSIHSDRTQLEREAAMRSFRAGTAPILIATGVTARGIDVRNVMHVINFDLPSMDHGGIEEYTHRIGRTGRIGHRGVATSLFTERDEAIASVLTRTLLETNQEIPEFLEEYKPEIAPGTAIRFETESDFDPDEMHTVGQDADQSGDAQPTPVSNDWAYPAAPTPQTVAPAPASNGWESTQAAPTPQHAAPGGWNSGTSAAPLVAPPAPQAVAPGPASNGWGSTQAAPTPQHAAPGGWNSGTSAAPPVQQQVAAPAWNSPPPAGPAPQAWGTVTTVPNW